jgi:hypothetical protein
MSQYVYVVKLILSEGGKYFVLLLFSVLAIRYWKNARRVSAEKKQKAYAFAGVATVLACGIGYVSIRHSMGRLYSYYGMDAFYSGNINSALSLFQTSTHFWRSPDAVGGEGVCVLLLNHPETGMELLDEAKRMRKGNAVPFEQYHEGLYYFVTEKWDAAVPLLESSADDEEYEWRATKMLSVITLETNGTAKAVELMKPFAGVEVREPDHAYIMACINLADGHTNDARVLVDKFYTTNCTPIFKTRFARLRAKIQN